MVVHPVDRSAIAGARIGFKIVNADAAGRPVRYVRMPIVYPDLASRYARGRQVHDTTNAFSSGMLAVRSGRPVSETNRVIAKGGLVAGGMTRLAAFGSRK